MALLHPLVSMFVCIGVCMLTDSLYCPCSSYDITNLSTGLVDYTNVSTMLIFSGDSLRNCRNISIENDAILEGAEKLFANLTTSDPDVILAPNATEIILDDSMY